MENLHFSSLKYQQIPYLLSTSNVRSIKMFTFDSFACESQKFNELTTVKLFNHLCHMICDASHIIGEFLHIATKK